MRTELYGTLAKAKLPTPTAQQLSYNLPISYLGMLIQRKNDHLTLSQPGNINDLLTKCPPTKRFHQHHYFSVDADAAHVFGYSHQTRHPDCCMCSSNCKEPSAADEVCLHRVIGYLAEYKDLELHCKVTVLQLHAYFDAGWACHSDMKDHSGMVLTLGSNLVHDYA